MIFDRYASDHPPSVSYTQPKLCEILLEALEKCSCLLPKVYSERKKKEFVNEISYIVKNIVGHPQKIHNDCSVVQGLLLYECICLWMLTVILVAFICTGEQYQYSMAPVI